MKKNRKPAVAPDEAKLFRAALSGVTPLRGPSKVEHEHPQPRPVPSQRPRDDAETPASSLVDYIPRDADGETGTELSFARNGIGRQTLRKLRRGHWTVEGQLDLHGLTVDEARELTATFLRECGDRGWRCVRIIHGKGLGSKNGEPVLKRRVAGWLMQRDEILAFCQARPADGGSGAVMVLLKSRR